VGPGISCGARKLARTPRVTKKKKTVSKNFKFWNEDDIFVGNEDQANSSRIVGT
jgi:hypothetical protein